MNGFWQLACPEDSPALVHDASGQRLTYGVLKHKTAAIANTLTQDKRKKLGLVLCQNTPAALMMYLAALQAGDAVMLLDAKLEEKLVDAVIRNYQPDWIWTPDEVRLFDDYTAQPVSTGLRYWAKGATNSRNIFPGLAVLLSTSGSTGSSKMVRLSYNNVAANAAAIAEYLGITHEDRPITTLPMPYSYGLSVINSHLHAGACILLTDESVLQKPFWQFLDSERATSMAGVPFTWQTLLRLKLLEQDLPSLRTLTQAGGRLDPRSIEQINAIASRKEWEFFVMYGQTEATARMSYVPPQHLAQKIGSVGIAIPEGKFALGPVTNELIYTGPNVMLGYAESSADLEKGDELGGVLHTGDVARIDEDGYITITGRIKRFIKLYGQRYSLDELETLLGGEAGATIACCGHDDNLIIALEDTGMQEHIADTLQNQLRIHNSAYTIVVMPEIPRFSNGKVDYTALEKAASS